MRIQRGVAVAFCATLAAASAGAVDVFDGRGFSKNRDFFSHLPYEHIDPLTGNLLLTFTDLVLPGNAGFDLKIQRTYNSKIYRDYANRVPSLAEDSWAGVGWTFHLGRVFNVLTSETANPIIEMPDGSRHRAYTHIAPPTGCSPCFITRDYWMFDKVNRVLKVPNGLVYTFGHQVSIDMQSVAYVTQIADPFGNTVTVTYDTGAPDRITKIEQDLGGGQIRTITFDPLGTWGNLTKMNYVGDQTHTWTFEHHHPAGLDAGKSLLKKVTPPVGPSWTYGYNESGGSGPWELREMTAPAGGTISYQYSDFQTRLGSPDLLWFRGVQQRTTSGPGITGGTWTYAYAQGAAKNQTTITGPCGDTTTYVYSGVGNSTAVPPWQVGLVSSRTVSGGGTSRSETHAWRTPAVGDRISMDDETVGFNNATDIYVPLLQSVTTSVQAGPGTDTFTTSYEYSSADFNDYGTANRVIENSSTLGTTKRFTSLYFQHAFGTNYIKARTVCEVQTVGTSTFTRPATCTLPGVGESFMRQWSYSGTGFLETQTANGLTTTFTATPITASGRGNVASSQNGNGHLTSYTYSWGSLKDTTTPLYGMTREIFPEGTLKSETRRGFMTSYQYDALFRVTQKSAPVGFGDPTDTAYDIANRSITVTRGSLTVTSTLDGFERETDTLNAVGVKTKVTYDACGRKTFESYPFEGVTSLGTQIGYDVLGRVTSRTNPDASAATYVYAGIDVAITDERGFKTDQQWEAFGNPDEPRLAKVSEPHETNQGVTDGVTQYAYNALGSLTTVTHPGGAQRTWTYFGSSDPQPAKPGLLKSETHPESGTVSYTYDAAGNLKTRVDHLGTTTYNYDGNERVTSIDRPGPSAQDSLIGYDASDNHTCSMTYASTTSIACSSASGGVKATFSWDGANRLAQRVDSFSGQSFTTDYTYWGHDGVKLITYPSGKKVHYEYDNGSRVTRITNAELSPSIEYAEAFTYHPSGATKGFKPDGTGTAHAAQAFTYHAQRYWPVSVNTQARVLNYNSYDNAGNVMSITDSRAGMNRSFTYDGLSRLKTATGYWGTNATFLYDKLGNRTNDPIAGSSGWTYTSGRLMDAPGLGSFGYSPSGNVTSDGPTRTYTYTPTNMMETATLGGATTTYKYDGDDARKLKVDAAGGEHYYIHGPGGQILSEYEKVAGCAQAVWVRDYVYVGTRLLASIRPDTVPVVAMAATASSVTEGAGTAAVQVRLTTGTPLVCPVNVSYTTANGTATAGADYTAAAGFLTFPANSPNDFQLPISVPILNDALDEDDNETFTTQLTGVTGSTLGAAFNTVTITDNDPLPALSISDVNIVEGNSGTKNAVFAVTLTPASGRQVSVDWATTPMSATEGVDYQFASWTLNFAAGQTSLNATVLVVGDVTDEPSQAFAVNLSNPQNATLSDSAGVGTILDDDPTPTISIEDSAVFEGDTGPQSWPFKVALSGPSDSPVTVNYQTVDVTALTGVDHQVPAFGTIAFAPGTISQIVDGDVLGDSVKENNETIQVDLSGAMNGTIGDGQATGTVLDDEAMDFFTIAPCRILDTRNPQGPLGGPALDAGSTRLFPVAGVCSIPSTAKAIAVAVTVVDPPTQGFLTLFPGHVATPATSTINFQSTTRTNNAVVTLGGGQQLAVKNGMASQAAHLVVDVSGYFQ